MFFLCIFFVLLIKKNLTTPQDKKVIFFIAQ
uniref:Uncharacterized protein n=1 Tax=Siphoviridae sp. ctGkF12 TaxID=2826224 RepID=A0A8S5M8J6_9CAUD|nr:MAG TPA: hypothetical protein [Siphoviridae sp. ctGkF12]